MKRFIFISFLLFLNSYLIAQKDTFQLKEVSVEPILRSNFNTGSSIFVFDSSTLASFQGNNLADLLNSESIVFIKSYGFGSLATSSVRGAGASHTKILWNGLDISNPMLGQSDLSYINVSQFDEVSLQLGNTVGLYGGGTQGGVIHLKNQSTFSKEEQLNLNMTFGSFGNYSRNMSYKSSGEKLSTKVNVYSNEAQNNFGYHQYYKTDGNNLEGFGDLRERENADYNSFGTNVSNAIKLNDYNIISLNNWYQQSNRGIPTILQVPTDNSRLSNEFFRNSITYNHFGDKWEYKINAAFLNELLSFNNSKIDLIDNSVFRKYISEFESKYKLTKNQELLLGVNYTYDVAISNNYSANKNRDNISLFAGYKTKLDDKISFSQTARFEFVDNYSTPITGSSGLEYTPIKMFKFSGSVSRNYRLPTFNDLYFGQLGNSNLKPELGWGGETSLSMKNKYGFIKSTVFINDYKNWINWQPQSDGLWRPQNNYVQTKGMEFSINEKINVVSLNANYSFTNSVNKETSNQLIYIPKHSLNSSVSSLVNSFNFRLSHQFIGKRFINSDNKNFMSSYNLYDLSISRNFLCSSGNISLSIKIHNVFNKAYQSIINQPMAGRYYQFKINFTFRNKQI